MQALQALTDDELTYDTEKQEVVIKERVSEPTRESGTNLLRELVLEPTVCTISYTDDNNSYMIPTYDEKGNLLKNEILYNPNVNFWY